MEANTVTVRTGNGFDAIQYSKYIRYGIDLYILGIQVLSTAPEADVVHAAFTREYVSEELHTEWAVVPELLFVFSLRSVDERLSKGSFATRRYDGDLIQ